MHGRTKIVISIALVFSLTLVSANVLAKPMCKIKDLDNKHLFDNSLLNTLAKNKNREWKWDINGYWDTDVNGDWDIVVPCDYPTIQEAVKNADVGDRILVREGVYNENIEINRDGIILQGEGIDKTIVHGNNKGCALKINSSYVKVSAFTFTKSGYLGAGITLSTSSGVVIQGNKIVNNNGNGIYLYRSHGNVIADNIIINNRGNGITEEHSLGNTIKNNLISNNTRCGLLIKQTSKINSIFGNEVSKNRFGIKCLDDSCENIIHHNNFVDNVINAYDGCINLWSYESEGNYWSDYIYVDRNGDGVGDIPYYISGENKDRHPLMRPVTPPIPEVKPTSPAKPELNPIILSEKGKTFTVDDDGDGDYIKIQYAVDNADPGDIIEVYSGTYDENIIVPIQVTLIGVPRELGRGRDTGNPVVNGNGNNYTFLLTADGVQVSGFDIKNKASKYGGFKILSNSNVIHGNRISKCSEGIYLLNASFNIITNNTINNNDFGIFSHFSTNNWITNNLVEHNNDGIVLSASSAEIINNTIKNNVFNGFLQFTTQNINAKNNTIFNHEKFAIQAFKCKDSILYNNILSHNFRGGISLFNCFNITVHNNKIRNNVDSISLWYSNDNKVLYNKCGENNYGVDISFSNKNSIVGNDILNSTKAGIYLGMSKYNSLTGNNMVNCGIVVDSYQLSCWWNYVDQNNTANGKTIYYYINKTGLTSFPDAGQVFLVNCSSCSINNLSFENLSAGVALSYSKDNDITNNFMKNVRDGITLVHSSNNNISGNTLYHTSKRAIFISWNSNNNSIAGNNILDIGEVGLAFESCDNNTISDNIVGKTKEFYTKKISKLLSSAEFSADSRDYIIEIFFFKIGIVLGFGSNGNLVKNNDIRGMNIGIAIGHILPRQEGNTVIGNTIKNNDEGIAMGYSNNNHIIRNTIYNSSFGGITMDWLSDNNYIVENHIEKGYGGIGLRTCNNNIILGNTIRDFEYIGIFLWYSANNTIQKNNFINNRRDAGFNNAFDNVWSSNYWEKHAKHKIFRRCPKIIRGGINPINNKTPLVRFRISMPYFNLDKTPATEPYQL